jgi:hypothetical protein
MRRNDLKRHSRNCRVCRSTDREQIESDFIAWRPQSEIAKQFGLGSRLTVFRHAQALGLLQKRDANIRAAIASFIERGMRVKVTAQSFVAACSVLSKLDAEGRSVNRIETTNELIGAFSKMTRGELRRYAETGQLPQWLSSAKNELSNGPIGIQEPLND